MPTPQPLDPRARRWGIIAKYAAILVVGFFVAPFVWVAIGGLVGMIVAGAIMLGTWMVLPAIQAAAANMRLKLIKGEASRNPVETLQNDLRDKTVALDLRKTNIEKLNGQIRTFADKVDGIRAKYGPNDAGYLKLSADLLDLRRISADRAEKWKVARAQLERYAEEISRANMIWDAAQAAAAARESSGLSEDDFYAKLRAETAFDSIQNSYNEALASLDSSMLESPAERNITPVQPALPAGEEAMDVPTSTSAKTRATK